MHVGVSVVFIHFIAAISMVRKIGLIGFGSSFPLTIFSRDGMAWSWISYYKKEDKTMSPASNVVSSSTVFF